MLLLWNGLARAADTQPQLGDYRVGKLATNQSPLDSFWTLLVVLGK